MIQNARLLALFAIAIGAVLFTQGIGSAAEDTPQKAEPAPAKTQTIDELLLFFPAKYPAGNWAPRDLRFQDVWFTSEDKTRLHGWYCPCERPRATILIAHGNAGHIASRAAGLKFLQSTMRVSVFIFDYRGYGRSEGVPGASVARFSSSVEDGLVWVDGAELRAWRKTYVAAFHADDDVL